MISYSWEAHGTHLHPENPHEASQLLPTEESSASKRSVAVSARSPSWYSIATVCDFQRHQLSNSPLFKRCCRILVIAIISVPWVLFIAINLAPRLSPSLDLTTPLLDLAFNPTIASEVVISMYDEPPASFASLLASLQEIPAFSSAMIHFYTKAPLANTTVIQQQAGALQVTTLPNIGRGGEPIYTTSCTAGMLWLDTRYSFKPACTMNETFCCAYDHTLIRSAWVC